MSMNKYMHPRNIYKSPPSFKELALEFPEFRPFVKQELTGKVTIDFKDLKALRALSCTLLQNDFGLTVEMPLNKLIPTIPLRLNYILFLEDLLTITGKFVDIKGIDIGTGASCVYPLLAAKKNNWSMIATEKDCESIIYARKNVETNNLRNLIKVIEAKGETLLEEIIEEEQYDFCMCNPPFFSSTEELHTFFKSRKSSRPHPKNAFCASVNEVVSKGGEVEFIKKLINESKILCTKIKFFSTMVGHKCNLPPLKKALREINVSSFKESYFCQGNTTRWGLAWTFYEEYDLRKIPDPFKQVSKCNQTKDPLIYILPLTNGDEYSLNLMSEKLLKLFSEIKLVTEEVSRKKDVLRYITTASSNTWSKQRRKRREKMRETTDIDINSDEETKGSSVTEEDEHSRCSLIDQDQKSPGKRIHDELFDGACIKKLKISTQDNKTASPFFKFMTAIKINESSIFLELNCIDDNREYLHQILQYIKNSLTI